MEITGRKRTIQIFILLACCTLIAIWFNSKWDLIDLIKQERAEFNVFEDNIAKTDSAFIELNQNIVYDTVKINSFIIDTVIPTAYIEPEFTDNIIETSEVNIRDEKVNLIIDEAVKHINVREATGNNDGYWVEKFLKITGLPKGHPWCAAYTSYVHNQAGAMAPKSARVVDWFNRNVVWLKKYGDIPENFDKSGMVGGLYYEHLGRLGHIFIILGEDKNNYYTIEGNTNSYGSREGDGVYKKIRPKKSISALADYTITASEFKTIYDNYLKTIKK